MQEPVKIAQGPLVSVVMATFRGAPHLEPAIRSVLAQSHAHLELVVVDDASQDGTAERLQELAAADDRLVPVCLDQNRGPAGARNAALDVVRGEWVAVVDADDLLHPRRLERLLAAARVTGADMAADDMVHFGDAGIAGGTLLEGVEIDGFRIISATDLIASDTVGSGLQSLGYLKPLVRRDRLGSLRYDETLPIGEDFDLYLRLLLGGARFAIIPDPTYLYRRHPVSTSHRLTVEALAGLISAHRGASETARKAFPQDGELRDVLDRRAQALERAIRYERLVAAIKSRDWRRAAALLLRHPELAANLRESFADRRRKKRVARTVQAQEGGETHLLLASEPAAAPADTPPEARRITVPPLRAPASAEGDSHRALACELAALASTRPLHVTALGAEGALALGYLPGWSTARLLVEPGEVGEVTVPASVTLERLPASS